MLDSCIALLHAAFANTTAGLSPPRMLLLVACFVQARGPEAISLVHEAVPLFRARNRDDDVWGAALIVILSGILVAPSDSDVLGQVLLLDGLEAWYEFGALQKALSYNRLSLMSIAGFGVLGMMGKVEAFQCFVRQMAYLTNYHRVDALRALDQLSLPFDAIKVTALMDKFTRGYQGDWKQADQHAVLLAALTNGSCDDEGSDDEDNDDDHEDPPVFFTYLSTFYCFS
jgi:hypothetical protein